MTAKPLRRLCLLALFAVAGCAGGGIASITGAALEATGMRKMPELPDAQKPPRTVALRLHAAEQLNVDAHGRPLALLARIYKLRRSAAFEQAPFDAFLDPQKEKEALGADLIEVREVMLVPGQHYEVNEKVSREAQFVGVVALFHAPAPQRWRLAFGAAEAEKTGMTIGAHACSLSASQSGAATLADTTKLSPVHCQ